MLEKIPSGLAKRVAEQLTIPVIGIGAGPDVDGQVLVVHDMLGITKEFKPRFMRRYAELGRVVSAYRAWQAASADLADVRELAAEDEKPSSTKDQQGHGEQARVQKREARAKRQLHA